jgi:signal peptidase
VRTAVEGVVLLAVVALVVGSVLGQPVLLSYVETGSMEPTLAPGDGFIAVPSSIAGEPAPGDVVVYEAEDLQGGGLTTHRIVDRTEAGYITKGDANPFTDQDGPEPPVSDEQIVAHALQVGGTVVVIPAIGTAIGGLQAAVADVVAGASRIPVLGPMLAGQGPGSVLIGVGLVLFIATSLLDSKRTRRVGSRSRRREGIIDTRVLTFLLLVAVLVPANAAMVLPGGVHQLEVTGEDIAAAPDVEPGDETTWNLVVRNEGLVPMVVDLETAGDTETVVEERLQLGGGGDASITVSALAPGPGDRHVIAVRDTRYLLVLPPSVIASLDNIHPFAALLAINAVLAIGVVLVVQQLLGFGVVRSRSGHGTPLGTRLRRKFG